MDKLIGILILNYCAYQDTIECVESILKQSYQNYMVVIVDNGSLNNSYEKLSSRYQSNEKIKVLQIESNVGFAKGNNIGVDYLKANNIYNVLVINGDTVMCQVDYLEKLANLKYSKNVAMVGTSILSNNLKMQNPVPVSLNSRHKIIFNKFIVYLLIIFYYFKLDSLSVFKYLKKKRIVENKIENGKENDDDFVILDSQKESLHGAAIFFTENYLSEYIGFYPDTFLYFEEELLALVCRKLELEQVLLPKQVIFHKEDASSDMINNHDTRKAILFKLNYLRRNSKTMSEAIKMKKEDLIKKIKY